MHMSRIATVLSLLLFMVGCGGGGGSVNSTVANRSIQITWPERSRSVVTGPSSAQSAQITLVGADVEGHDVVMGVDRHAATASYVEAYPIPGEIRSSASQINIKFFAQSSETGDLVGTADATFSSTTNTLILTNVVMDQKVASVTAVPATINMGGTSAQLVFTAEDSAHNVIALTPGSAIWAVSSGSSFLNLSNDGMATGLAVGTATVHATVDGITSPDANISVQQSFTRMFHFSQLTDTIQLKGGALQGACDLGDEFTVEAIIRPISMTTGVIWQQWSNGSMNEALYIENGKLGSVGTGSGKPDRRFVGDAMVMNAWNHVAWTYDGVDVRLYHNGTLVLTQPTPVGFDPIVVCQNAAIGKNGGVPFFNSDVSFLGDLAEFRISNSVRYSGPTYSVPTEPFSTDASTLMLIDASSFSTAPNSFAAPGSQGIIGNVGVGGGSSTAPAWIPFTP